jgi:uncharacterized membrane protein YvbJ
MMVYCHNCGAENEDDEDYCSKCGEPLKEDDKRSTVGKTTTQKE